MWGVQARGAGCSLQTLTPNSHLARPHWERNSHVSLGSGFKSDWVQAQALNIKD